MEQTLVSVHYNDENGNPAGGFVEGIGIDIHWQNGPLVDPETGDRREPSGAFVESVIQAAIDRIEYYQASKFACVENEEALSHLRTALSWCNLRTARRTEQGVEGTHELHSGGEEVAVG